MSTKSRAPAERKLWGGRFDPEARDPDFERFSQSFSVDRRLVLYDLQVNQAYVKVLGKAGVLGLTEVRRLTKGLRAIEAQVKADRDWYRLESAEDVHTWVESRLESEVGPAARKLRTGRSRNDLVATETRLWAKAEIARLQSVIIALCRSLAKQARRHLGVILPGYTHLQPAQPILFSHYLLAYFEMLRRDHERFRDCGQRVDELPLGGGALAGTSFQLDREMLAHELGFERLARNSIDVTSDRDFVAELLFACALTMVHLTRLAEDFIIYSSPCFGFIELADAYSTGSSIMPQKKNPDSLELIRGKAAGLIGKVTGVLTLLKGLPLAYDRDLQEDKAALFEGVHTAQESLVVAQRVLETVRIHPDRMKAATDLGFLTATEIADELVERGVSFGEAHEHVGRLVRYCASNGKRFADLEDDEALRYIASWDSKLREIAVSLDRAVRRKDVVGGTAPRQVAGQLRQAERWIRGQGILD